MIAMCNGTEIYLFEYMYLVNSTEIRTPVSTFLYGIELIFIMLSLLLTILTAYLNFYDPIWHRNLQYLMAYFIISCVPSQFSRLVFIWYEFSTILEENPCQISLVLATIFRLQYGFAIMHAAAALILERAAAYYFLKDYERKCRYYIPTVILFVQVIFSGVMAIYNIFFSVSFQALFIYMSVLASASLLGFCTLWQLNLRKFRRIGISARVKDYSLSKRFQLTENLRAFQSIRNMQLSAIAMVLITGFAGYFMVNNETSVMEVHFFESLISCAPVVLCGSLLASSQKWREFVKERICGEATARITRRIEPDEGQVYFTQLNKAWNKRPHSS